MGGEGEGGDEYFASQQRNYEKCEPLRRDSLRRNSLNVGANGGVKGSGAKVLPMFQ